MCILTKSKTTSYYQSPSSRRGRSCVCCECEVASDESSVCTSKYFIGVSGIVEEPKATNVRPQVRVLIIFVPSEESESCLCIIIFEFYTTVFIIICNWSSITTQCKDWIINGYNS